MKPAKSCRPKPAVEQVKSFRVAADKIQRARNVLGTTTDSGSIETARDTVTFREDLLHGLEAMAGIDPTLPEAMDAARECEENDYPAPWLGACTAVAVQDRMDETPSSDHASTHAAPDTDLHSHHGAP